MPKEHKDSIPVAVGKETTRLLWPAIHFITKMEQLLDRLLSRGWPSTEFRYDVSLFDNLFKTDGQCMVCAELSGVERKNPNLLASDHPHFIKTETRHKAKEEEKMDYFRHEISSFVRACLIMPSAEADVINNTASIKKRHT